MTLEDWKLGFALERELDPIIPRTTRKRMVLNGEFPAPVQISEGRVGTPWFKVKEWMESRPPSQMKSPNPKAQNNPA